MKWLAVAVLASAACCAAKVEGMPAAASAEQAKGFAQALLLSVTGCGAVIDNPRDAGDHWVFAVKTGAAGRIDPNPILVQKDSGQASWASAGTDPCLVVPSGKAPKPAGGPVTATTAFRAAEEMFFATTACGFVESAPRDEGAAWSFVARFGYDARRDPNPILVNKTTGVATWATRDKILSEQREANSKRNWHAPDLEHAPQP